ncbi:MAG: hypothetical protein U0W24_07340 [Bacteroidales bacterium]
MTKNLWIKNLRRELFWDMDTSKLDAERNIYIIIERILMFGNLSEFLLLKRYYGKNEIEGVIKKIGYLDPKTFEFVISYFKLNPKDMKCFAKRQLNLQHWT